MSIVKKEEKKVLNKELANLSARGQEFLRKQGLGGIDTANVTADEAFHSSVMGGTTMASQHQKPESRFNSMNRSVTSGDGFQLPSIGKQSPFKGFLDISIGYQKLRKEMHSQDGTAAVAQAGANFDMGSGQVQPGGRRSFTNAQAHRSGPTKANHDAKVAATAEAAAKQAKIQPKGTRFQSKDKQVQMSPKVLETWINETLRDAEHLDIPGVILKPEHQNPIYRYGIDRVILAQNNIPIKTIERIYKALFVYSVGFHELIQNCLQHTEKKYTMITNIWKVFAILLEYCCRTDYRMLISEISKEHKADLDKLDRDYQKKSEEQANNEKVLKENLDTQQKMCEELQREMMNEKQMRLKLQEDFTQNTKNHEEEVQLRLKFESKLNNMHSAHRDLETRYKKCLSDWKNEQDTNKALNERIADQTEKITKLKTTQAENETEIAQKREELESAKRELAIKGRQIKDNENRTRQIQEALDLMRYDVQNVQKENTEMKLKLDVLQSTNDGLTSEKKHLTLELKETKELLHVYEEKTKTLMEDLQSTTGELQMNKREMIGFSEINREREEKITELKRDVKIHKTKADEYELKLGTLQINYNKMEEQLTSTRADHDELVDKLHLMNKARHEVENKLQDEQDRNKSLADVVSLKDDLLDKRQAEIEELDKRVNELINAQATLEAQKAGVEKAFELSKTQLNDRIKSLNEVIANEKETRELWIQRYEDEQKNHTNTNSQLLQARSELKDQVLALKNTEIKLNSANRQIQILQEQNLKFQHQVNEAIAKAENLDRELNTQKEILKQMEMTKKEYINKLKKELDTIELRYQHLLNENTMIGEDFRSRAHTNLIQCSELEQQIEELKAEIRNKEKEVEDKDIEMLQLERKCESYQMQSEEFLVHYDEMRGQREKVQADLDDQARLAALHSQEIDRIQDEHADKERKRIEDQLPLARSKFAELAQINIAAIKKERPPQASEGNVSSRQNSIPSNSGKGGGRGRGRAVGGGGQVAGKPPMARQQSRPGQSANSKTGLAIDTTSQQSKNNTSEDNQAPQQKPTPGGNASQNSNHNRSQNDETIPTPRNLQSNKNSPGSGILNDQKRSVDDVSKAKTVQDQELADHAAQSATQSQHFKTLEESKSQLIPSVSGSVKKEVSVKQGLVAGNQSEKSEVKQQQSSTKSVPEVAAVTASAAAQEEPTNVPINKEASEKAMNIGNEVIEEKAEHEEEERKSKTQQHTTVPVQEEVRPPGQAQSRATRRSNEESLKQIPARDDTTQPNHSSQGKVAPVKTSQAALPSQAQLSVAKPSQAQLSVAQPSQAQQSQPQVQMVDPSNNGSRNFEKSGTSTVQGAESNNLGGNSQSRIKVDLSQQEEDAFGTTGMEDDQQHHMIQPKPMLGDEDAGQMMHAPVVSQQPPPQLEEEKQHLVNYEMNQMEIQFNTPAHQATVMADQQRASAIQNEMTRQKEIQRLQQQSQKMPTGNTSIRKLIKSAATRDGH